MLAAAVETSIMPQGVHEMPKIILNYDAVQLRRDVNKILEKKVRAIRNNPELDAAIQKQLLGIIEPYVPYKSGRLSESAKITKKGIRYSAKDPKTGYNYTEDQYHIPMNHTTAVHPKATDHWDIVAMSEHYYDFVDAAAKEIKKRFKEA